MGKESTKWISTASFLVVVFPGKEPRHFKSTSKEAKKLKKLLEKKEFDKAFKVSFPEEEIYQLTDGKIKVNSLGKITDEENNGIDDLVKYYLTKLPRRKKAYSSLLKFSENLKKAKNDFVREQLSNFLKRNSMPLTPDGCFIAYKSVYEKENGSLVDAKTKKISNNVGDTPRLDESECDWNPNNVCSRGLHASAWDYASNDYNVGGVILAVKINPADVASVPGDYNFQKLRCLGYTVLARDVARPHDDKLAHVAWNWDLSSMKGEDHQEVKNKKKESKMKKVSQKKVSEEKGIPVLLDSLSGSEIINLVDRATNTAITVSAKSKASVIRHAQNILKGKKIRLEGKVAYIPVSKIPCRDFKSHDMSKMSGSQIIAYVQHLTGREITVNPKSKVSVIKHATALLEEKEIKRYQF